MIQFISAATLGACIPLALEAAAAVTASVNVALPDVQAKVAGLLALQAQLTLTPPSLSANLTAALDLVASLQAAVSLGLPGVDFQLAGVAALLAELQVTLASLQAQLALAASFNLTLGAPGIHLYSVSGPVAQVGQDVSNELAGGLRSGGGPTLPVGGVLLLASDAGGQAALSATFAR